jgi:hypothetical protein
MLADQVPASDRTAQSLVPWAPLDAVRRGGSRCQTLAVHPLEGKGPSQTRQNRPQRTRVAFDTHPARVTDPTVRRRSIWPSGGDR